MTASNKTLKAEVGSEPHYILQCRACRRFLGYATRRVTIFCPDDIFCATTREWVWDQDRVTEIMAWLHEVEGFPIAEIAAKMGIERYRAHGMYQTFREKLYRAKM
ncbi:hypothetical protein [Nonomuraea typhae]|uniref:Uncharacterized protein n=1 Tax=Nonomuraea typhae TaxID=2603600 RepID=A0ABW7YJ13_9ACTN